MKILDSTKSLSTLASSSTNGVGQINPISCVVTEELNGIYEAEFQVSTNDKYYPLLKQNGLVKIKVGDNSEQIFRIYSISEPINFVVTCKCQHITYDLSKVTIKPFSATGASNCVTQLLAKVLGTYPFTMTTDISNTTSTFNLNIPRSWRECLGGYEGSLLDTFRGEYEYDNLTVKMLARRGADNGVKISYGKNLTDFEQEQNNENVYDAVYGYAIVDEVTYEASGIYNKTSATTPKVLNVDFSNKYDSGQIPTAAELLSYATTYATNNDIEIPRVNIKISFIPLWQTDEYKDILPLERVKLGDTVHVYFDKLGVTASSRVIKTVWNALTEKYDEIELGDARANLNTVINEIVSEDVSTSHGFLESELESMSKLIVNGLGLHITRDTQGRIYLHNAEDLATSQYQYIITSSGFMLSEDYGQTWSSGWDISGNAILNSLSTITLKALEIYGSYIEGSQIRFGDANGTNILARVNDNDTGVLFEGSGYVEFEPQGSFSIKNMDSSNNVLNYMIVDDGGGTVNRFIVQNNHRMNSALIGNIISMLSSSSTINTMNIINYQANNNSNTNQETNSIKMVNDSTSSSVTIMNINPVNNSQNFLEMKSDGTMKLYCSADMQLLSGGAIRMQSMNSQDIVMQSGDDLHLNYQDKLYFNGRTITLGTGGYVMWS